jgi:hypothetical protein
MQRRILASLLFILLLPIVGSGRLLWRLLAVLAGFRPQTLLMLVGLAVALSLHSPVTEQLAEAGIWPIGHVILVRLISVVGVGVLYFGLRSSALRRLWWKLQRRQSQRGEREPGRSTGWSAADRRSWSQS